VQGDELTFDYNYERYGSARPMPCLCYSTNCRGVLGAPPKRNGKLAKTLRADLLSCVEGEEGEEEGG